ncbi:MAG: S8 family serine peptidase, partial [bacterium]|nr:S8 family serine peptidase [bacterium]
VERTRGIDLINNQGDSNGHGTGVSGILSSEVRNKRLYVGVAPGAEILMADRVNNDYTVYIPWAETNGADVMLYEYGGYVWHFLDGSEAHEIMVNEEADKGIIQVTPAGNLGNSKKHCAVPLSAGINRVNFDIPSGYNITAAYFTILWTESTWGSSGLTFQLYEPGGISITVNGNGNYQTLDNHDVWSLLSTSSRNTYRMDVYIDGNGGYVDIGNWYIDVNNINGTAGIMHGYLADNMTSWSSGAVWLDSAYISDFPTLCFPATSDKAIVVGSYSTRGIMVPTGSLSLFSSRGDRIDGTFMMDVTAPGNYDLRTVTSKDRAGVFGVYAWFSGTSAAGPHVAAAAALIKQADPGATHLSVENDLQNFCLSDTYTGTIPNNEWGYGKLRLLDLIDSKIYWDSVWPGGGFILNPEWSSGTPSWGTPGEKYIAYIKGTGTGTCDVYVVNTTGTPSPQKITTESDNVNHNSQISWSPDDNFIIFASTTVSNNLNIFKISSDPGNADSSVRVTPSSLENWGRMLDPDWASALNQYNNVERIVMSVSGDIWVYEPNNNVDSDSGLIRITELSDPYQDYSTVDKCLQPKWSEDNTKVVFIRRPATAGETPAPSNVYVINDIQEIISGNRSAINSWSDTYLVQITNNSYPSWSPSFSIDGTKIGYCQDVNSVFNNITFNDSPALALIGTNFDAFDEWGNLIGTPNLNNDFNEGFVKWAPSGGDKFIYVKEDSGEFKIRVIRDETIGGFTKSSTQIIKDKSRSYISIDSDDFYKFSEIKFYSPLFPPSKSPKNFKPTGEYRHILADNREADLENNATLCISFSQAEVRGYNEKNLGMFYWNPQFEKWEEATNVFVNIDGDGIPGNENLDGGFVVAEIRKLGLYGIFAKSKTKQAEITDLSHVRVFPNPYRPAKGEGDEYWGVVFDRLPQNIQEIRIYNLSGELVATTENAIQIFPGWYFNYDYYHYYDNQDPNHKFARWGTTNDNGKPVASGIYIYVIKSETDSKTGKLAIIR